ncbi:IpaC/SipC family type III secretion system effector [Yersinia aldovae]|uniref:IpaC/SipC family type III secretion system effector n=1 Tax=Yersinia aldovae TaxID=29483 RepID=UPI0005ABD8B9|nr:IpaC/SipC family type III secretion system effector [Yersinia aldovae]AJJ61852.1 type III secretion target, IpaC/SipC family protein [Yersinia aldovae 670-83]
MNVQINNPTLHRSAINIEPNQELLSLLQGPEQNATGKLALQDVEMATREFGSAGGKPQLPLPTVAINLDQMSTQIGELLTDVKTSRSDNSSVLSRQQQVLTAVLQRENAKVDMSASDRIQFDALVADPEQQRQLAVFAQAMLADFLQEEVKKVGTGQEGGINKIESADSAKQLKFIGIQSSDMMHFLLSMLRQVMAELNIAERNIHSMFNTLNAEMTQMAADSTIREGKEIYRSAVIGFCTSFGVTLAGSAVQTGITVKQHQAVNKHLKPANQHHANANELKLAMHQTGASAKSTVSHTGADGKTLTQVATPSKTEQARFKQQQQQRVNEAESAGDLQRQKFDQKNADLSTAKSVADQSTRLSDNMGQMASASNTQEVKRAEADKMMESSASDAARGVANDKDKQIDKLLQDLKEILGILSGLVNDTGSTLRNIVMRG